MELFKDFGATAFRPSVSLSKYASLETSLFMRKYIQTSYLYTVFLNGRFLQLL